MISYIWMGLERILMIIWSCWIWDKALDFGDSGFFKGVQQESTSACDWSSEYEEELLKDRFLPLDACDFASDDEENRQRRSKRARSDDDDSLGRVFALLVQC